MKATLNGNTLTNVKKIEFDTKGSIDLRDTGITSLYQRRIAIGITGLALK